MRSNLSLAVASLLLLHCNPGPPDTRAACTAIAHAWCQRLWDLSSEGCYDATGYISNYTDKQQCEDEFQWTFINGAQTCANTPTDGCGGALGYSAANAGACVSGVASIACDPDMAFVPFPRACTNICCRLAGELSYYPDACCSGSAHESTSPSCAASFGGAPELVCD